MFLFVYFMLGLFMGSFLHVVGYRLPTKTYFASARSVCPTCKEPLKWYALIPVVSYIFQRGKCLACKEHISMIYPFSEICCGLLFSMAYIRFGSSMHLFFGLIFISILFILTICDIYYYLLPNMLVFILALVVILWNRYAQTITFQESFYTLVFSFVLIGALIYWTKGGMGIGDLKLLMVLAYFFGFYTYLQLLLCASLLAVLYFLVQNYLLKKPVDYIFFGPFIAIAACLLLLVG